MALTKQEYDHRIAMIRSITLKLRSHEAMTAEEAALIRVALVELMVVKVEGDEDVSVG